MPEGRGGAPPWQAPAGLVPWDDRRAHEARVEDLREGKVREYLRDVRSGLLDEPNERDVYRRMRLTTKVNDQPARSAAKLHHLD